MPTRSKRTPNPSPFPYLLLLGLFCFCGIFQIPSGYAQTRKARVQIDAVATKEYRERIEKRGPNAQQTYSFYKGQYYGGTVKDKSLETVDFQNIIDQLGEDMRKQNFVVASDGESGDLLIVVHYGVTTVEADWEDLMGITSFESEEASISEDGEVSMVPTEDLAAAREFENLREQQGQENQAGLLGIDRALNDKKLSNDEKVTLHQLLENERYFIVLMAYDWQKIRKDKEAKLVWSTRFSMPATGTNFEEAYYSLSRAASPYFGTHLDKITKEVTHKGAGTGTVGELEVVDIIEEEK